MHALAQVILNTTTYKGAARRKADLHVHEPSLDMYTLRLRHSETIATATPRTYTDSVSQHLGQTRGSVYVSCPNKYLKSTDRSRDRTSGWGNAPTPSSYGMCAHKPLTVRRGVSAAPRSAGRLGTWQCDKFQRAGSLCPAPRVCVCMRRTITRIAVHRQYV